MAIMAITTSSSIRVNALELLRRRPASGRSRRRLADERVTLPQLVIFMAVKLY
jgi:hypothetical protein